MPLYYEQHGSINNPTLIFLHGFLGNHSDWHHTIEQLKDHFHCIAIDLPGHGNSVTTELPLETGFSHCHQLIRFCVDELAVTSFALIGYSLGGRIALDYARTQHDPRLTHLLLESSHIGLQDEHDKMQRYHADVMWATSFATQSIEDNLYEWYDQAIFNDLSDTEKKDIIEYRMDNYGVYLSNTLLATSLSQQICALPFMQETTLPISYFYGENDAKFQQIANRLPVKKNITIHPFTGLGHNIHIQQPINYAEHIKQQFL